MDNTNVNHPSHYGGGDNPYETIKVLRARLSPIEYIGALKFLVYKYNDRAPHKGTEAEDYAKGQFYQNELVRFVNENWGMIAEYREFVKPYLKRVQ